MTFRLIVLDPPAVPNLEKYRLELNAEALKQRAALLNGVWKGLDPSELEPIRLRLEVLDRKLNEVDRLQGKEVFG